MGIVYLAHEVLLDRPVALKVLHPELASSPAFRERFLREARTAARLSHPHIVPIHAVDRVDEFVLGYASRSGRGPAAPPEPCGGTDGSGSGRDASAGVCSARRPWDWTRRPPGDPATAPLPS